MIVMFLEDTGEIMLTSKSMEVCKLNMKPGMSYIELDDVPKQAVGMLVRDGKLMANPKDAKTPILPTPLVDKTKILEDRIAVLEKLITGSN